MGTRNGTIDRWLAQARRAGWRVKRGGKNWRLYPPNGKPPMTVPSSPGRGRSLDNTRAHFRRRGLEVHE